MSKRTEYTVAELSENALFVQILSNYPNMFRRPTTKSERARQEYARYALTHTFNEKCKSNLTIKQISRKINNMKSRLKDKNTRDLLGTKSVKYHDWEKLFLNMWRGGDTSPQCENVETENQETNILNPLEPEHHEHKYNLTHDSIEIETYKKSPKSIIETSDIDMKIEPHFSLLKDQDEIGSVSDISTTPHWQIETEITEPQKEVQLNVINSDGDDKQFEKMSIDELKRIALISQTKMFKAQEAAARSKEQLNLYKLLILKQENRDIGQN